MKIAIPIWNDRISPVFDTASRLLVVELKENQEFSRDESYLGEQSLTQKCFRIQGLKVDLLICGAISRPFARMILASGIDIIQGITGPTEDVLHAYLHDDLSCSKYLMPGCKGDILIKQEGLEEAKEKKPKTGRPKRSSSS